MLSEAPSPSETTSDHDPEEKTNDVNPDGTKEAKTRPGTSSAVATQASLYKDDFFDGEITQTSCKKKYR